MLPLLSSVVERVARSSRKYTIGSSGGLSCSISNWSWRRAAHHGRCSSPRLPAGDKALHSLLSSHVFAVLPTCGDVGVLCFQVAVEKKGKGTKSKLVAKTGGAEVRQWDIMKMMMPGESGSSLPFASRDPRHPPRSGLGCCSVISVHVARTRKTRCSNMWT